MAPIALIYFPEYRLAVECDENDHDDRDPDYERKRARYIKRKLQCDIIRYNPDTEDFNMLQVINQIFRYIKEYIQLEKELEE